jgi:hypothetical protein
VDGGLNRFPELNNWLEFPIHEKGYHPPIYLRTLGRVGEVLDAE